LFLAPLASVGTVPGVAQGPSQDDPTTPEPQEAEAADACEHCKDEGCEHCDGAPDDEEEEAPEEEEFPGTDGPTARMLGELVAVCRQYVMAVTRVELDGTIDTLSLLDHYLTHAKTSLDGRTDLEQLTVQAVAAYFGEVARREVGGFWLGVGPDIHTWRVCCSEVLLCFNPVGMVYDALNQAPEHGGPSGHLRVAQDERPLVAERLDIIPEYGEGETYLLTTRLEILEAIVETLRESMRVSGYDDVRFDAADYEQLELQN
jgi:hypothetical protein